MMIKIRLLLQKISRWSNDGTVMVCGVARKCHATAIRAKFLRHCASPPSGVVSNRVNYVVPKIKFMRRKMENIHSISYKKSCGALLFSTNHLKSPCLSLQVLELGEEDSREERRGANHTRFHSCGRRWSLIVPQQPWWWW